MKKILLLLISITLWAGIDNIICGVFTNVLQTHKENTKIEPKNGAHSYIYDSPSCNLQTPAVIQDPGSNKYIECNGAPVTASGIPANQLNIDYSFTLAAPNIPNVAKNPGGGSNHTVTQQNEILPNNRYKKISQNWHHYNFQLTYNGDKRINKFDGIIGNVTFRYNSHHTVKIGKFFTGSYSTTRLIFSDAPYNIEIYKLKSTGSNRFSTDLSTINSTIIDTLKLGSSSNDDITISSKNIKIKKIDVSNDKANITLTATEAIEIGEFLIKDAGWSGAATTVTIRAPKVIIGNENENVNFEIGDRANVEIYADEIDINEIDFGQYSTLTIKPYTTGRKIAFHSRQVNSVSHSQMIIDSGDYYITKFTATGTNNNVVIRALNANSIINLFLGSDLEPGNNPGFNSAGNNGNFGNLPPQNFRIFINGDLETGGGGTTFNALIYVEGEANLGSPTYIKGALSTGGDISVGNNSKFYYPTNGYGNFDSCTLTPIAEYRLDECEWNGTVGEVRDSSGHNNHATAHFTAPGKSKLNNGACYKSRGNTNYYIRTDNKIARGGSHQITIMGWIKVFGQMRGLDGGNVWQNIWQLAPEDSQNSGNSRQPILLLGKSNNRDIVLANDGVSTPNLHFRVFNAITYNQWHHIAQVIDGRTMRLYVDGNLLQEYTYNEDLKFNDGYFYIGNRWEWKNYSLDEVKIFDKALSKKQIETIIQNESNGKNYDGSPRNPLSCQAIPIDPIEPQCEQVDHGILLATYDISDYTQHFANSHSDFNYLESNYAIDSKKFGEGIIDNIDTYGGNQNPYHDDPDDKYLSIINGYIYIPQDGEYTFAVDGNDAVEFIINDSIYIGEYSWHSLCGCYCYQKKFYLKEGYYKFKYRQQDWDLGDGYRLFWKKPENSNFEVVPAENFFHCPPPPPQPIAEYRFDECKWSGVAGEVRDYAGDDDNLTAHNAQTIEGGKICRGGKFEPATDGIVKGDFNHTFQKEITLMAWFKTSGNSDGGNARIVEVLPSSGNGDDYKHGMAIAYGDGDPNTDNNWDIRGWVADANGNRKASISYNLQANGYHDGNWHLIVYTYDGATGKMYLDNGNQMVKVGEKSEPVNDLIDTKKISIGRYIDWANTNFNGLLDEIKIFDRALDKPLIQTIYEREKIERDYQTEEERICIGCDLCYSAITYETIFPGMCVDFGPFQGGIRCRQNIPIVNLDQDTPLENTLVALDTSIFNGNFFGDCGVENGQGDESCTQNQAINFGPVSMFQNNITYNLTELYPDSNETIWEYSMMNISLFNRNNLYGYYEKDGRKYSQHIGECSINPPPPTYTTGHFDAWDTFRDINDRNISTKIVNREFSLTIASINQENNQTEALDGKECQYQLYDMKNNANITNWNEFNASTAPTTVKNFTIDKAYRNVRVKFRFCQKSNTYPIILAPLSKCQNSENGYEWNETTTSSDNFAIRPYAFKVFGNNQYKRAGEEFNVTIKAVDEANKNINSGHETDVIGISGYDTSLSSLHILSHFYTPTPSEIAQMQTDTGRTDIATCPNPGIFTITNSSSNFIDGKVNATLKFSETGILDINVSEKVGSEWAKVDAKDKNVSGYWQSNERFIKPAIQINDQDDISKTNLLLFIPYKFETRATYKTTNNKEWLYMNDINKSNQTFTTPQMAAYIHYTITAKNKDGAITQNYTKTCFPDVDEVHCPRRNGLKLNTTFDLFLDATLQSNQKVNISLYSEDNSSNTIWTLTKNNSLLQGNTPIREWISPFQFEDGVGEAKVYFNIDRNVSQPIKPTSITLIDANTSTSWMSNPGSPKEFVEDELNTTKYFYYARLHAPSEEINKIVGNEGDAKVYYEIYDPDGNNTGPLTNLIPSVDDIDWYINDQHTVPNDGDIYQINFQGSNLLINPKTPLSCITRLPVVNGIETIHLIYNNIVYPYVANMEINTSKWLIYNKYEENVSLVPMRVKFISSGVWKGVGKTLKKQNEINITNSVERRINW